MELISFLKLLCVVVDLKDHTVFRSNKETFKEFVLFRVTTLSLVIKIKGGENRISSMMIKDYC